MLQMKEVTVGAIGTCCYILWQSGGRAHDCRDSAHAWAF